MGQYHGMTYILNVKRFYFVQTQEKKSTLRCASLHGVEFFLMGKEERGGAAQGGFLLLGLFIPLKHKLGWLVKPVLSVIDYQLLNFFLRKEIRPSRERLDYRSFILRVDRVFLC